MSIKISYSNKTQSKSQSNLILFTNDKFNISGLVLIKNNLFPEILPTFVVDRQSWHLPSVRCGDLKAGGRWSMRTYIFAFAWARQSQRYARLTINFVAIRQVYLFESLI